MECLELTAGVFHLRGGSNMGLVVRQGQGLLIDTGLDKDAARRALRIVREMGVSLQAVFVTHAHADHFGGAYWVQRRAEVELYAPALEAAMMENPIIEPLFLFGGAAPVHELRHKFTLAKPCRVDHLVSLDERVRALDLGPFHVEVVRLPGHAPNQMGVAVDGVLFCADAFFAPQVLDKHKVPFCFDLDETVATLEMLPDLGYDLFAPGHGNACTAGEQIARACAVNRERLLEVRGLVWDALAEPSGSDGLVAAVCERLGLHLTTASGYWLTRTTVLAALSSLQQEGRVEPVVEENRLRWRSK